MRPLQRPEFHAFPARCRLCIVVISLLFIHRSIFPQQPAEALFVDAYGIENGLRQSMVSQIHQDRQGMIWIVTGDGLHCFDGREFRVFRIPYKGVYSNSDNMMRMLVETEPGSFVIASSSSLFRFNASTGQFSFIIREKAVYHALFNVLIDRKPLVWSRNTGFCLVDDDSLCPLKLIKGGQKIIPEGFVPIRALQHNKKDIIVLGDKGILLLRKSEAPGRMVFTANWYEAPGCKAMASDKYGRTYFVKDTRLYRFHENGQWDEVNDLKVNISAELTIDRQDNFWFSGSGSKRLFRLSGQKTEMIDFLEPQGRYTDTIRPSVKHVFEDNSGNLWFGTDGNGLLKYNPGRVIFSKSLIGFTRCLTALDRNIIAGTYNKGLWKLSEDLKQSVRLNPELFGNKTYILDLATDTRKRIWVATDNGLYVISADGAPIFSFDHNWRTAAFIENHNDLLQLQCDSELYTFEAGRHPALIQQAAYISVNSRLQHSGAKWTGTPVGLFFDKVSAGHPSVGQTNYGTQVSQSEIYQLMPSGNELWAATGNGIELFSGDGKVLKPYPALDLLKDETIYALLPDEQQRIWFSGIRGIGCITTDRKRIIRFSSKNNLQSLEFNHNAACKGPGGRLYFGGINGVNAIAPSSYISEEEVPSVSIFSLFTADTAYTQGIVSSMPQIRLNRNAAHIRGSVFTADYPDAADQRFSFLLQGYQPEWSEPAPDAGFSYRNLPPGEYRLLVRYSDPCQNQGEPELLLTLVVEPAFWQTLWFALSVIVSIIIITVLVARKVQGIRYANRIKALEQEHAIEKERLRISKDMHDEVGASLTRISILSEIARSRQQEPDNTQKVIEQISEIAGNVVDELSEIIWAMNPKNDSLDNFAAYVRRYASTYLEASTVDVKFHFPDTVPNLPMSAELRRNLFLIIKEALHNVIKHSGASKVMIALQIEKKRLNINLKDDGQGFDAKLLPGTGNGLHNMRRRMEDCGGDFRILSAKGQGTEIILSVEL